MQTSKRFISDLRRILASVMVVAAVVGGIASAATSSGTSLSDLPLYSASNVPANLMLALSVEYPTAVVAAYKDAQGIPYVYTDSNGVVQSLTGCNGGGICYYPAMRYLGYFDNAKCYSYDGLNGYFTPVKVASDCTGYWSGNMLNWSLMTSLDEFRQALTGGARSVDTVGTTVLVRSKLGSQSSAGNFPDRQLNAKSNVSPSTVVGDSDLSGQSTLYIRSYNQGTQFIVSTASDFSQKDATKQKVFNAQVKVCVPTLLEANCKAYGSNYKPEGLIQQNFERIRVGASAYAYQFTSTNADYPNGAIRALLHDNGPTTYNGNGARQANTKAEWSSVDGTFYSNPTSTEGLTAAGSAPTDSGVINYLNKFGNTNNYERYDTIADLYWATLAYYMHVPLADAYTSSVTSANSLDTTFPVFKGRPDSSGVWDTNDPMAYTCQSNAILMIGDSHTHCDSGVPTSTGAIGNSGTCGTVNRTTLPVVNGADAGKYVNALGNLPLIEADPSTSTAASKTMAQLQGTTALASIAEPGAGTDSTYNMAGLAYFAHTQDIRTDGTFTGKQTVDTYVVDVMEPTTYSGATKNEIFSLASAAGNHGPNMYWLAAKYGGFNDINGDGRPANFLTWHTNTSTQDAKDLRPDNYFIGNRPDLIVAGLASIFSNVSSTKSLSAAGPSVSPTRVLSNVAANTAPYNSPQAGFPTYNTSYLPGVWTGDVNGYVASAAVGANVSPVANGNQWSAAGQLLLMSSYVSSDGTVKGWRDLRRIATMKAGAGVSFTWSDLSNGQKTALRNDSSLLDYLRGDRSNEGTKFRVRSGLLGDIVNSQATLVQAALSNQYVDSSNPGYRAFVASVANRAPVTYVGANDGMMHAFAADFSSTPTGVTFGGGGQELWAYVPSFLFNGPSNADVDGLAALSNLKGVTANAYSHHFYVDQTPQVADVDFAWTSTTSAKQGTRGTTPDWRTLLVGGVGKGGKGLYALDVTQVPSVIGNAGPSMGDIKSKVLWEFTDPNLGYTYARPLVVKTRKYGWVVLVTSGYNNADGKGYLFILNAKTGLLLETMNTTIGSTTSPIGLARPSAFTQDISDNTIEQVYAGDLQGNVWRFDLSMSGDGSYPAPVVLATLKDSSGVAQPITTAPRIETDFSASGVDTRRWVFVGTGKFLDTSDLTDTQVQSMYALRDGSGAAPSTAVTPITRAMLAKNDLNTNLNLQDSSSGWFYDLSGKAAGTGGATERIVVDPDAVAGIFAINWGTLIPTTDPCSLKGAVYSSTFASGLSNLLGSDGKPRTFIPTDSAITNLQAVQLPTGEFVLLYGQTSGLPATANMQSGSATNGVTRANWREILN
ncbi:pilus assembly protein [Xanthomonas sp. NCPPB 2632]|uniref:pilus assembly protein n=1 Tax=Xanthomonas sp. NCPPB 2632 TaxID=3240912 RepID=UPI003514D770